MKTSIIAKLAKALEAEPNQRVGQLIENAVYTYNKETDIFYISDEDLEKALDEYIARSKWFTPRPPIARVQEQVYYTADPDTGRCFGCGEVMVDCAIHAHDN